MNDAEMISLQSHTIGSIGEVIKLNHDKTISFDEIDRIYKGYIKRLNELLMREAR